MALLMAYRMTASCITAAIEHFELDQSPGGSDFFAGVEEEESEDEQPSTAVVSQDQIDWHFGLKKKLKALLTGQTNNLTHDSKLNALIDTLRNAWREDEEAGRPHRKVVVFSFFRRTLEYLRKRLTDARIPLAMIHGGIDLPEREESISRFLDTSETLILLASDVGGEGIDLQKASILVNYDLPWNPMVVEQRIGRIDRIGQASDRIVIINLVVEDTVEDKILQRLLTKIDIFRSSIGEIDPIVGEKIFNITAEAVSGKLSERELEDKLKQNEEVLDTQIRTAKHLLENVDKMIAADQALMDEINAIVGEKQIPTEYDLLEFVNRFLANHIPGCQLPQDCIEHTVDVDLRGMLHKLILDDPKAITEQASRFAQLCERGPIKVTFSREMAFRYPNVELIHMNHPLVRVAIRYREKESSAEQFPFCLHLKASKVLDPGIYSFAVEFFDIKAVRTKTEVRAVFVKADSKATSVNAESGRRVVIELLETANDLEWASPFSATLDAAKPILWKEMNLLEKVTTENEMNLDLARQEQQHAAKVAYAELRVRRAKDLIRTLEARRSLPDSDDPSTQRNRDFPVRMAKKKLENLEAELLVLLDLKSKPTWGGLEREEIAVGILKVGP